MNAKTNVKWMADGLCHGKDAKFWFPSGTPSESRKLLREGVLICMRCPVMQECRDYAMKEEPYGTWGALDEVSREIQRAEQGIPLLMTVKDRQKVPRLRDLTPV